MDSSFGPQLSGHFDFTLGFEHIIFTIVPVCTVIAVTPSYIRRAANTAPHVRSGWLLWCKLIFGAALLGVQIANLVLWTASSVRTSLSITAASLSCAASFCILAILYVEHIYSLRCSTFLSLFFAITGLLDIACTRSYFNRHLDTIGGLNAVVVALKFSLLILEEVSKGYLLRPEYLNFPMGRESVSGFWNRSLFVWLNSTLTLGFRQAIRVDDLSDLGPEMSSKYLYDIFTAKWSKANKTPSYSLLKTCVLTLPWPMFSIVIPRLCFTGFTFAQPFLLRRIVHAVGEEQLSRDVVGGLIGATALIYFGIAVSKAYYEHLNNRLTISLRGMLTMAIFEKVTKLTHDELQKSAAVTLMSTDMSGVETIGSLFHSIWANAIELGLGIYVLSTIIGPASVLVVVPALITTFASSFVVKRMGRAKLAWNEKVEARIAATSSILSQIKSIKMSGLTGAVASYLQRLRTVEIDTSMQDRRARVSIYALSAFTTTVTPVIVLGGAIFWTRSSEQINVADTFMTLSVVSIISEPLAMLLAYLPFWAAAYAAISRIQKFLLLDEMKEARQIQYTSSVTQEDKSFASVEVIGSEGKSSRGSTIRSTPCSMELEHVSVTSDTTGPILRDITLKLAAGSVAVISGPVGCGKSTLLKAILGEVKLNTGSIILSTDSVAYCDQTTWIQNTSIRHNIVGFGALDLAWYKEVLYACALDEDLHRLSDGDETLAGSGGCNLSGGQKQRLALARAIYSRKSLLILDDALSALDTTTSTTILFRLLGEGGVMRNLGSTVVMTTNLPEHLPAADQIFLMDLNGRIKEVIDNRQYRWGTQAALDSQLRSETSWQSSMTDEKSGVRNHTVEISTASHDDDENRRKGDRTLYSYYLGAAGYGLLFFWLFTVMIAAVGERMPQIFVRIWLDRAPDARIYYTGFAVLGVASVGLTSAAALSYFYAVVPRSSLALHKRLLDAVMGATLSFLMNTDNGSILNRFSQDMTMISQRLPIAFLQVCFVATSVLVDIGIVASGTKYAAPIIVSFLIILYCIQRFYLRTSRQIRFLDLEAKSPLFTHFTETSSGIQHIRAFHWQTEFKNRVIEFLDYSQKPYYYMFCINRWLSVVIDTSVLVIAVVVVAFALSFSGSTSQTAIGLAMLNLVTFSATLSGLVTSWVSLETSLGAISRIRGFCRQTPSEIKKEHDPTALNGWPAGGKIDFNCVTASYNSSEEGVQKVLDNVTMTIMPGQKVGIIGRTGSGKSSLLLTVLNLIEYAGSISIDGREIRTIPVEVLRSQITTMTQDGIELKRSVRTNVDMFRLLAVDHSNNESEDSSNDGEIINALRQVGLWSHIQANGGLNAELDAMGLSQGQKQLLHLARAILRQKYTNSSIVLIDEATSNLDIATDMLVQTAISQAFAHCTVLTVSHRAHILESMDTILEVDNGRIIQRARVSLRR